MKHLLDWMGEHPILTVVIIIVVGLVAVDLIHAVRN